MPVLRPWFFAWDQCNFRRSRALCFRPWDVGPGLVPDRLQRPGPVPKAWARIWALTAKPY